ncbi:hypothetical protein [Neptunicella marina]|uniref:Uncharacterized protein n=1 Tax=Neptunicella marina TaxID=2125989 RepID=A0A8J6IUX9_9ALTE|nr:hypothetical protein [Neptunicella marina]MBC3766669.1 hypothetical protein [Neptunicella marina]
MHDWPQWQQCQFPSGYSLCSIADESYSNELAKEGNIVVYNPYWLQIIFYLLTTVFVPGLTVLLVYCAYRIWLTENLLNACPIIFMAGLAGYLCWVLLPVIKYIPAKLEHDDNGFSLQLHNKVSRYSWPDIAKTINHGVIGVLHLVDKNGQIVFVVHKCTPGYKKFAKTVFREVGIRS